MATTSYEPADGLPTAPLGSRAQSAAAFHPAGPDSKPGRLHGEIEAVNRANDPAEHEISFGPSGCSQHDDYCWKVTSPSISAVALSIS
jgi:hypothetical protein